MKIFKSKKQNKTKTGYLVYKRLLSYVRPYKSWFFFSIIGFLIYAATQPLFAAILKHIIDSLQSGSREDVGLMPLLFIGLILLRGTGSYLGNYFIAKVSTSIVHALRCEIFNHYTGLPTNYFDSNNSGYMMSRITHNVGEVTQATTDSVQIVIKEGLTALGLVLYLFYMNWLLTLAFLSVTPFIVWLVKYVSKRLRSLSKDIQNSIGNLTHITSELVSGHRIVRSYGGEEYEKNRFKDSSQFHRRQSLKLAATSALHGPLLQLIISIALAGLMYLSLTLMQEATAGEFVAFLTAAFLLPRPIRQLSDANSKIQKGVVAAESLFAILDEPVENDSGEYEPKNCRGRIEFKNVRFKYQGAESEALKGISFTVEPGQTVALVGASGGGKSTLINLLPRFYEYSSGQILLDGVDITAYKLENLRRQIAVVTQQITLFNDTVANNIAYGALQGVSLESVEQAAKDAYAMKFIQKMPKGLQTEIGENGVKLSGGQKQRLALARALLKNAPVLILDEATSALDTESERYIQKALQNILTNRTTIVVAHRLSTIENADVILVMDNGQIVEQGSHKELLAKNGHYARLYDMQFNGETNMAV
ncbi:lipid A export permease/ATP-binding protein MsbA [Methylotuvimicrobium alcaliphilum]|uniref:Lipid A export ATP-binding/permease protein MsbA n=1 Tax=Methylotuvimicrobium alcaliphilum (strain DSM 19304 / NCIMB 14124 / VKM B-2133 / 20Z) TaxID=1091494 RepID=G4SUI8_META2|nr:lipid A export permease/ATP-binding protein MsbA [Methylotuvimicrobium alcaliphilum]CCE21814.1 Lipid A export ATP-binding/permease protein MsbA [Methylotuvimicrobium alcaliphilum 20Z]